MLYTSRTTTGRTATILRVSLFIQWSFSAFAYAGRTTTDATILLLYTSRTTTGRTTTILRVPAECESTLHTCDIGMADTLQHGVNQHCLTKAHLRWSSSCFSHRHSLLVVCMSQNGVNRYCISMALSGHWRPIIEAGCTRRHCIPVTLIWQTHCSMVWTNTACMSQNGVNRYCISMALSGHWRPIIEARCTRRHCIPVTLIWQTHCSMVWTNTA